MKEHRRLARSERRARKLFETANERFQRRYGMTTSLFILVATGVHFGVFALNPCLEVAGIENGGEEIVAMPLPPEVRIPPPPSSIARPARPKVSDAVASKEITIAPTTFEANPIEHLAPPPAVGKRDASESEPFYVPRDIEPRLLNGTEVADLLKRKYPPTLCDAGIEGVVLLWIFVDETGGPTACRVHTSSGYPMLDAVAEDVVRQMKFAPARHMDRPVGVWIAQPVQFRIS
jgi:protein TonB